MSVPKIYLNENLSWKIAKAMREYGYDVVSSHEIGMNAEEDDVQFDYAISEKRAVVTNNFADLCRTKASSYLNFQNFACRKPIETIMSATIFIRLWFFLKVGKNFQESKFIAQII